MGSTIRPPDIPCFECGESSHHDHHVVPRSLGGTKTVPLCNRCHGIIHDFERPMARGDLVKKALADRAAKGIHHGGPYPYGYVRKVTPAGAVLEVRPDEAAVIVQMRTWRLDGVEMGEIAKRLNEAGTLCRGRPWTKHMVRSRVHCEPLEVAALRKQGTLGLLPAPVPLVVRPMTTGTLIALGQKRRREQGKPPGGGLPYGVKRNDLSRDLEPELAEQHALRSAREWGASGVGRSEIARRLNATRSRTRHGSAWTKNAVAHLLYYDGPMVAWCKKAGILDVPDALVRPSKKLLDRKS